MADTVLAPFEWKLPQRKIPKRAFDFPYVQAWCDHTGAPEWYVLHRLHGIWMGLDARQEWKTLFGERMPTAEETEFYYAHSETHLYDMLANSAIFQQWEGWPEELDDWVDGAPPGVILEFGCGFAPCGLWQLLRGTRPVDFEDLNDKLLGFLEGICEERYPAWSKSDWWQVGKPFELEAVSLGREQFQYAVIMAIQVLEHLHNPLEVAGRLVDRLMPGGRLILANHFPPAAGEMFDKPSDIMHLKTGMTNTLFDEEMKARLGLVLLNPGPHWAAIWEKPK